VRRTLSFLPSILLLAHFCLAQNLISWKDAAKYYNQTKTVEGTVVVTRNTGKVCFLNFSENWRTDFTAVIFASDLAKFPASPEAYYKGKKVRITGRIQEYRGKPEVILKSSNQIWIME
jgi:micrococcal nuclease